MGQALFRYCLHLSRDWVLRLEQASEQDLQDRQDSQDAEDVQDQQDVQDVQDAQDVQDGQDVQDAQDVPDVEDVEDVKDETHDHAEQDVQAENDTLLSSLQAEQNPKLLCTDSQEADLADLAEPEAAEKSELGELKIDDVESQAQASLREAGGRFSEENLPSINEVPFLALLMKWLKRTELCPAVVERTGQGTSRDAGQGLYDFKGVMDDESGLSGSWMKEFQETLEAKSEEVQAPEDFIQAEAEEAELGTKEQNFPINPLREGVDREEILLRGKDWSALAAECDALLQSCKRRPAGTGA
eukprot:Skav229632  [mRNA]  locus=scaffold649:182488:189372:- [translate_table: standard]